MPPTSSVLAFAALSFVLIVTPGPSVLFVIGQALRLGRTAALVTVAANGLGFLAQITQIAIGAGAALTRYPNDLPRIVEEFAIRFDDLPEAMLGVGAARMLIGVGALVAAYVVHGVETQAAQDRPQPHAPRSGPTRRVFRPRRFGTPRFPTLTAAEESASATRSRLRSARPGSIPTAAKACERVRAPELHRQWCRRRRRHRHRQRPALYR